MSFCSCMRFPPALEIAILILHTCIYIYVYNDLFGSFLPRAEQIFESCGVFAAFCRIGLGHYRRELSDLRQKQRSLDGPQYRHQTSTGLILQRDTQYRNSHFVIYITCPCLNPLNPGCCDSGPYSRRACFKTSCWGLEKITAWVHASMI